MMPESLEKREGNDMNNQKELIVCKERGANLS